MSDALSSDEVRKVARLARLALSDDEIERQRSDLAAVLGYVERLGELDLSGVEPMAHVGDAVNRLRGDEPGETLDVETVMRLAPESTPPFLRVPKVIGDGGEA